MKNNNSIPVQDQPVKTSRKLTHGSAAAVFTAFVIAAVIMLNIGFSAFAKRNRWYVDMTKEKLYTLSDETKEILKPVTAEVNIYFTREETDLLKVNDYMKYIYNTALDLEKEFPNIHVKCVDIIENPGFFDYYYNSAATNILTSSVIVESNGEFRLLSSDAFLVYDENHSKIWGYNGESKFASSILQVTSSEMPTVCFTEGHGEPSLDDAAALRDLCESAGYNVKTIDLSKEEIDDDVRIVIINDPVYDFAGIEASGAGNEIDKLSAFLNDYGTVFVFADSEKSKNLTNLSEMLAEWGIEFSPGKIVVDDFNSLSVDGRELVAEYETENTLGASLYNAISSLSSMPKTIVPNAMPLKRLYETDNVPMAQRMTSTVLYSSSSSQILENGKTDGGGRSPLMTITRKEGIKDNDYIYAYLIVCGSPSFVSDKYLNSNAYANSDIIFNTVRLTGREKVVANIDLKMFEEAPLDVTVGASNVWTFFIAALIPLAVGVVGFIVCFRRRRT